MISNLASKINHTSAKSVGGDEPILYRLSRELDKEALNLLLDQHPECQVFDTIESQLKDLIKLENPSFKLTDKEYQEKIDEKLAGTTALEYGVWVYYPWKNALVHLLDEEEFIKVRTIRNAYKITFEEQEQLRTKKIGVVGLSVGQSVVMTMALERTAGEFFIADFDRLELSNMNRIRTGVSNLGLLKGSIVKREIAEIDPFIKVHVFNEGITKNNIEDFLEGSGKLDLVVEECDNLEVKLLIRKYCRDLGIPVLMESSDRGMLDVERFDLDRDYPIFHGLVDEKFLALSELSNDDLKTILFQILNFESVSERGKVSLLEVGKSISSWPQLGSDVILGGAVVTMTSRMVLLNQITKSIRTYVDVPSIINK